LPGLVALQACSGGTPPEESVAPSGWIGELVGHPERFQVLVEANREGWVAFHARDEAAAIAAFKRTGEAVGEARAELQVALFHEDLARVSGLVHTRLWRAQINRNGLPAGSRMADVGALAAWCGGSPTAFPEASAEVAQALAQAKGPEELDLALGKGFEAYKLAAKGDLAALEAQASRPFVTEASAERTREIYDPCAHAALARAWMVQAFGDKPWRSAADWGQAGLPGTFLAPWTDADALGKETLLASAAGELGAGGADYPELGVVLSPQADEGQGAREETRGLDSTLGEWRVALNEVATDDGKDLLSNLGLIGRFRQEWLMARARKALREGQPRRAQAFLDLAHDVATPGVGPANSPSLYALLAEAEIRQGHTREALVHLQTLVEARPVATGIRETAADLAVLETIDRLGDSKEP
jgi:hypothetical protein